MPKFSERGVVQLIVLLLLLAGIAGGVYLTQHPQIFKSKAGSDFSQAGFYASYGSKKGDAKYDPQYDADNNGVINSVDKILLQF